MEIVDGYVHCGVTKYRPIEEVRRVMAAAGVGRAVLVQHLGEFDNSYLERVVADDPRHFAGVCLVDHESPDAVARLTRWVEAGHFKGVRFTTDVCLAAPHLLRTAAQLKLVIMLYAPSGIAVFVRPLVEFLDACPTARLVVTHLGNPNLAEQPQFPTYRDLFRLAEYPNTYYQISGMKMFCPYPHEPLYGLIQEAAGRFGPARLCWGSNWPVVGDEQDYIRDLRLLVDRMLPLPAQAIPGIAGGNALGLWFEAQGASPAD